MDAHVATDLAVPQGPERDLARAILDQARGESVCEGLAFARGGRTLKLQRLEREARRYFHDLGRTDFGSLTWCCQQLDLEPVAVLDAMVRQWGEGQSMPTADEVDRAREALATGKPALPPPSAPKGERPFTCKRCGDGFTALRTAKGGRLPQLCPKCKGTPHHVRELLPRRERAGKELGPPRVTARKKAAPPTNGRAPRSVQSGYAVAKRGSAAAIGWQDGAIRELEARRAEHLEQAEKIAGVIDQLRELDVA